jgi:hypothetical protein
LELLLERAVSGQPPPPREPQHVNHEPEKREIRDPDSQFSPSSNSQSSQGAGISSDNHDGTLLLDEGQSQFVSSLHYALLADEVGALSSLSISSHTLFIFQSVQYCLRCPPLPTQRWNFMVQQIYIF